MNKKLLIASSLILSTMVATHSYAETNVLVEVSQMNFEDSLLKAEPSYVSIGVEYNIDDRFSLLAKYGLGLQEDSVQTTVGNFDVSVSYITGIYAKALLMKDTVVAPYLVLGYTKAKLTGVYNSEKFGQSEDGFSYAVGAEYKLNDKTTLDFNYSILIDNSDADMKSLNFGASFSL